MIMAAAQTAHTLSPQDNDRVERSGPPPKEDAGFYLVLTYFRKTNAEGLRIRTYLARAVELAKSGAEPDCTAAFSELKEVLRNEVNEAYRRARAIEDIGTIDPKTEAWFARELVQVRNAWDDLDRLWGTDLLGNESTVELIKRGQRTLEILDQLIFLCACQTIPDELGNYLENYRIGTSLDFVATFKDQLPDEASTQRVLQTLAPQSVLVPGLIDVKNARVIKADQRPWRQMLSVLVVLFTAAVGFLIVGIAVHLGEWLHFSPADWSLTPNQWASLNGGYLLILAGVLAHWVLDRLKQNRAGSDVTPFSEWLMWVHVNEVPITVRIMTVWLLLGMGIAFKTFDLSKALQPVTYFTAGYFIDSTFDALIGQFNTFVTANDPANKAKQEKTT